MAKGLIWIVEDNDQNFELADYLLTDSGFAVDRATDAPEFDRLMNCGVMPNLILMDMQLPGVSGLDLVACLRALGGDWVRIPVVALTAHAMRGDRERFLEAGCSGYIAKPIDVKTFTSQVLAFLAGEGGTP